VRFQGTPVVVDFAREWGLWPQNVGVAGTDFAGKPLYVMMRRKSIYSPTDWELDQNGLPIYSIARQGVDLLRVYTFESAYAAYTKTEANSARAPLRPES
jgi:hypothetical protein